jgi:hypothetical protein
VPASGLPVDGRHLGYALTSPFAGGQKQQPLSGRRPVRRPAAIRGNLFLFLRPEFFDRRRRDIATGGVRADRIGAKPLGESSHEGALARVSTLGGPWSETARPALHREVQGCPRDRAKGATPLTVAGWTV